MALHLKVPSIVCEGCAETITEAIKRLDSDAKVDVNLESKAVTAETAAAESAVREAIAAKGHSID